MRVLHKGDFTSVLSVPSRFENYYRIYASIENELTHSCNHFKIDMQHLQDMQWMQSSGENTVKSDCRLPFKVDSIVCINGKKKKTAVHFYYSFRWEPSLTGKYRLKRAKSASFDSMAWKLNIFQSRHRTNRTNARTIRKVTMNVFLTILISGMLGTGAIPPTPTEGTTVATSA